MVISGGRSAAQAPLEQLAGPGSSLEDAYLELTGNPNGDPS